MITSVFKTKSVYIVQYQNNIMKKMAISIYRYPLHRYEWQ